MAKYSNEFNVKVIKMVSSKNIKKIRKWKIKKKSRRNKMCKRSIEIRLYRRRIKRSSRKM